jgi:hypothetical protein
VSITVYWACIEDEWMAAEPPELVSSVFYKKNLIDSSNILSRIDKCPGFSSNLKNLYTMRSLYDYSFTIKGNDIYSPFYDQEFMDKHLITRSMEKRFFSFQSKYLYFTDSPSLNVTFYEYPYLEDNNITASCMPVAGQFDIGKWFRSTEFAFYLKSNTNEFKINRGEIYSYMRFHTDKKINFVQFRNTAELKRFQEEGFSLTKLGLGKLENYYKMFKNKKKILEEIKKNLI